MLANQLFSPSNPVKSYYPEHTKGHFTTILDKKKVKKTSSIFLCYIETYSLQDCVENMMDENHY